VLENENQPFRTVRAELREELFGDECGSKFTRGGVSACLVARLRLNRRIDDMTGSIKAVFLVSADEDFIGIIYAGPHFVGVGAAIALGMKIECQLTISGADFSGGGLTGYTEDCVRIIPGLQIRRRDAREDREHRVSFIVNHDLIPFRYLRGHEKH
jgi:hypothetical protein